MKKKNDKTNGGGGPEPRRNGQIPVVGIGASAGGVGALEALLPLFKADGGIAYVIVQHLDPKHESALTSLLNRGTEMPVVDASDNMPIERDHIYVIRRDSTLTMADDRPVITAAKFYRWETSNLTKMMRVSEWVQVAGHWRPRVMTLQDLGPGGDTTTITFTWHEQPGLPASAFTPSGLKTAMPAPAS